MNTIAPMKWSDFQRLPKQDQKDYITYLQEQFNVTAVGLAKMFGVTDITVRRYLSGVHDIRFTRGKSMKPFEEQAWLDFIDSDSPTEYGVLENTELTNQTMNLRQFSFEFSGCLNIDMICDSLRNVLGDSFQGTIEVVCELN